MRVVVCKAKDPVKRTERALEILSPSIPKKDILIKPNLVEPMNPDSGAITRPEVIRGIINYLDKNYKIIIGESSAGYNTKEAFEVGGYHSLPVKLVDFDEGKYFECNEFEITEMVKGKYLISAAVLKQHMFSVTLSLKNMMGVLKPKGPYPNKSYIHDNVSEEVWAERLCDLLEKVKPNLAVIDGTTGMYGSHLYGKLKVHNLTIVSEDPVSADIVGAGILGNKEVTHISKALKRELGEKPQIEIFEV